MAKVSLRLYNREIEGLIDQGGTNEAIAHCRHILTNFPKHLETYRLLGKSYLESHRYSEAVDVFSRVLMSVPDDFVSHVGMSIICDEQNRLDDSIWHMERAFESQPSNPAIQGELQRLYGRRDGMEPPKVRMTRGALAHMYMQGELYPQAIAEIRAVLGQDPQRVEMQVMLAHAYYKSGQKADSSEMCTQLLKQYPYCFEANRIMTELLPSMGAAAEGARIYRSSVGELDPYSAHTKGSVFQSNEVPDNAVNLERLTYTGEEVSMQQDWGSSLGIGLGASSAAAIAANSSADQPDWLKDFSPSSSDAFSSAQPFGSAPETSAPAFQAQNEIPDFLRQAGWGESSGAPEQPVSFLDSPEPAGGGALAPADMPEWLKGQAPSESVQPSGLVQPGPGPASSDETPDWLSGLGGGQFSEPAPVQPTESPDWLSGLGGARPVESAPAPASETPDWLSSLGGAQPEKQSQTSSVETPDWLSGFGGRDALAPSTVQLSEQDEAPDLSSRLGAEQPPAPFGAFQEAEPAQAADIPDWIKPPSEPVGGSIESLGASAQEQDDAVAWLESLAAKHGAKPEELVTDPNKRSEKPPEWVEQARLVSQAKPSMPPEATIENLGASAQEQDDAVAWLESLAAKHGARPEELVTDPSKRSETPPEWVEQARAVSQSQPPVQPVTSIQDLGASAQEQDDAVAWLESLAAKHGAKPEELVTDPGKRSETPPDWVQQARSAAESQPAFSDGSPEPSKEWSETAQNIGEQFFSQFEDASSSAKTASDETGMWLRNKEEQERQGQFAQQISEPAGDLPDWIGDSKEPAPGLESPAQKTDLPDWLGGVGDESGSQEYVAQHIARGDLSDWLSGLDDEPVVMPQASTSSTRRDLPEWLTGVDAQEEKPEEDWKKPVGETPAPASIRTEEPAPVSPMGDLPDWLMGVDDKSAKPKQESEEESPWLREKAPEHGAEPQLKPTSPTDWHPVEPKPEMPRMADFTSRPPTPKPKPSAVPPSKEPVYEPIDEEWPAPEPSAESLKPVIFSPVPPRQPTLPAQPVGQSQPTVPAQPPAQKPATVKKGLGRGSETQPGSSALIQAKEELDRGDIPAALEHYGKLIKKGKHLEETIRDLSDSIYRYPVEVSIWQTLGDAYMRANRLKEALEAYNKAEELIR